MYGIFFSSIMALISNPITSGSLTEEELADAFSAERSFDILSTDCDSSTEGSVGGESSFWESSDRDDITGDESDDTTHGALCYIRDKETVYCLWKDTRISNVNVLSWTPKWKHGI